MARYSYQDPPEGYKQSRAALRDRYGTRSIGGPTTQSPLDMTPSGIEARVAQRGGTKRAQRAASEEEFRKRFAQNKPPIVESPPVVMPPQNPDLSFAQGGLATPKDIE